MSFSWRYHREVKKYKEAQKKTFKGWEVLAKVTDVHDGDTITVTAKLPGDTQPFQYKVRLFGIDTPELSRVTNEPNPDLHLRAGREVRDRLTEKIPLGAVIAFRGEGKGKFGRKLGTLRTLKWSWAKFGWVGKENLNSWLLEAKLALPYDGKSKQAFEKDFLEKIVGEMKISRV